MECECKIDYVYGEYELNQCPLCKAAPALLAACENLSNAVHFSPDDVTENEYEALQQARDAITAAKPK